MKDYKEKSGKIPIFLVVRLEGPLRISYIPKFPELLKNWIFLYRKPKRAGSTSNYNV